MDATIDQSPVDQKKQKQKTDGKHWKQWRDSADQMNSCTVFRIICARHAAVKSPFWMNEVTHDNTTSESSMTSCKQLTGDPHEEWFKSEWKHVWMRSVGIVAEDLTRLCPQKHLFQGNSQRVQFMTVTHLPGRGKLKQCWVLEWLSLQICICLSDWIRFLLSVK